MPNTASPNPSPPSPSSFLSFPRKRILHNKAILREALRTAPRLHHPLATCLHLSHTPSTSQPLPPVAFLVTKKCGSAVTRNRLKRLFREAWRQIPQLHPQNKTIIWLIHPPARQATFQQIQHLIRTTLLTLS